MATTWRAIAAAPSRSSKPPPITSIGVTGGLVEPKLSQPQSRAGSSSTAAAGRYRAAMAAPNGCDCRPAQPGHVGSSSTSIVGGCSPSISHHHQSSSRSAASVKLVAATAASDRSCGDARGGDGGRIGAPRTS
eukprot:scaffold86716_cov63-Phaeocystis_antarctica.AAC.1